MSDEQVTPASFAQVVEGAFQALQITDGPLNKHDKRTYRQRHEEELEKLAQEVEDLPTVIDKRTRQLNQDQLTKLVRTGSRLDDHRKDVFRPIIDLKKEWDGYIGTTADAGIRGRISAMAQAVKANIEAFDKAEERRRQEELERQEAENTRRRKLLVAEGMTFDGDGFTFGPFRAEAKDVYAATPEKFETVLLKVKQAVKAKKDQEEKERQEREAAAEAQRKEAARLKEEADRQAEERRKFEEERAEFNRQKEEREAKELGDKRFEARAPMLRMIGVPALPDEAGQLVFKLGDLTATEQELRTMDDAQWADLLARFDAQEPPSAEPEITAGDGFTDPAEEERAAVEQANEESAIIAEEVVVEEHPLPTAQPARVGCVDTLVRPPDEAPKDEFSGEPLTAESAVFQALGEASMCWDPKPTGVFDSTRCKAVGDKLMDTLRKLAIIHN